jgi:hypothetical protein
LLAASYTRADEPIAGMYTRFGWEPSPDPATDPGETPPEGYYLPAPPFATFWSENPDARQRLGWAEWEAAGEGASVQRFTNGLLVWVDGPNKTWVFWGDLAFDAINQFEALYDDQAFAMDDETRDFGLSQIERVVADPQVAERLGAAREDARDVVLRYQLFEHGLMLTDDFLAGALPNAGGRVLKAVDDGSGESGTFYVYTATDYTSGSLPEVDSPPDDYALPAYPFLAIWGTDTDVRDTLGWSEWASVAWQGAYQLFERGVVVWLAETSRTWVFYSDGDLAEAGEGVWRVFWDEEAGYDAPASPAADRRFACVGLASRSGVCDAHVPHAGL